MSSSETTAPLRRNSTLRIDPLGPGPPAATTADNSVDWLVTV